MLRGLQSELPELIESALNYRWKITIRYLTVNALLFLLVGGCGPIVQGARFPQRPDSVKVGSLLGPFEGRVLDADTKRPIVDAVVVCSWAFVRGMGNAAAEAMRAMETTTDVDGHYRFPALRNLPIGLTTRLSRFSLVAYKKGYAAYRHDRNFGQQQRHRTFSQHNNRVMLSRWSPELSHARHLLFLGGHPAIRAASNWELLAAAAELDSGGTRAGLVSGLRAIPGSTTGGKYRLDARVLLSSDDIRTITGYTGAFTEGRLQGARSEHYDTYHFHAKDRPERYDVAIRLWRLDVDKLTAEYEKLLKQLPGSRQTDEVADRSFSVLQGEILGMGFLSRTSSVLVLLTCGRGQCTANDHLQKLAKKVLENTSKLPGMDDDDSLLEPPTMGKPPVMEEEPLGGPNRSANPEDEDEQ